MHVLAGLRTPSDLSTWARRGASFEGLVIEEISALARERVVRPGIHFWRTEAGGEVDLVITDGTRIVPIDVKLAGPVDHHALRGLRACMADLGVSKGWVVVGAGERTQVGRDLEIVPWSDVLEGRCDFGFGRRR